MIFDTKTNRFIDMRDTFAEEGRHIILNETQLERYNSDSEYNRVPSYVIDNEVPTLSLEQKKAIKLGQLNANFQTKKENNYFDETEQIYLGSMLSDIEAFSKDLNGHRNAIERGSKNENDLTNFFKVINIGTEENPIWSKIGHQISIGDYLSLLDRYFWYNRNLEMELPTRAYYISIAEDETTLNGINLEF